MTRRIILVILPTILVAFVAGHYWDSVFYGYDPDAVVISRAKAAIAKKYFRGDIGRAERSLRHSKAVRIALPAVDCVQFWPNSFWGSSEWAYIACIDSEGNVVQVDAA